MLKKFFWVLLFGSFISCQTGPLEPDPIPVVIKYTITAEIIGQIGSVNPSTIDVVKGSGASFLLVLPFGYEPAYITVNGVQSPLTSTTYSLLSADTNTKLVFEIKMNRFGLLIWKPWKGFLERWRDVGSTEWTKSPASWFIYSYIFSNERYYHYHSLDTFDQTTIVGDGPYLLTNDSLLIGFSPQGLDGIRNKVDVLTTDTLRTRSIAKFYGTPKLPDTEIERTYIH